MKITTLRSLALVASITLTTAGLTGCSADNHKTQKQAATEQWNTTRAAVLGSLANDQYRSGNLDKCQETVAQAIKLDPQNAHLHVLSARVDIEQGRLESADRKLKLAAQLDPTNAEVDYIAGVVNQRWQRPAEALACYRAAVEKKNDDVAYVLAEAEMLVALDRRVEAIDVLSGRAVYFEHSAAIRDALGQLLEQAGRNREAIEYYRQAAVLDGEDMGIRERLGSLLYREGSYTEALSALRRVMRGTEADDRNDLRLMAAESMLMTEAPSAARKMFDEVANRDPSAVQAWCGSAKCSLAMGDLRRAELAAVKAAALQPQSAQTQTLLGYVRLRQGRVDDAIRCFERAIAADKNDAISLGMMGLALNRQGRSAEASDYARKALTIDPHDELALKLVAFTAD